MEINVENMRLKQIINLFFKCIKFNKLFYILICCIIEGKNCIERRTVNVKYFFTNFAK